MIKLRSWLRRVAGPPAPLELDAREGYALWAARYPPAAHNRLMQLEERAVLALLPDSAGRSVLDLACGSGRYLNILASHRARRLVGCDLSAEMLARATGPRVRADATRLPFADASFDLVVCGLMVGHVDDLAGVVAEMARVLAPGGTLVYSDFHPVGAVAGWRRTFESGSGREYALRHHIHFYEAHVDACARAGLAIDAVREPRVDWESPWHGYPAALILRARRP